MDVSNRFKKKLLAGEHQIGFWCSLCSNYAAEVLAGSGFDWLLIDTEHAPNEIKDVFDQLQALSAYPTHPVVRISWNDMVQVKRLLDIGVQTLLFPYIQNAEEAKRAVSYTRYPPAGVRGVAGNVRANRFGRVKDYSLSADQDICVLVQVETAEALNNIEAIASVEGVDGIFVGPGDLHASLGMNGQFSNPAVVQMIEDAMKRINAAGKPAGIIATDDELIKRYRDAGGRFIAVGTDVGLLARESEKLARRFKQQLTS